MINMKNEGALLGVSLLAYTVFFDLTAFAGALPWIEKTYQASGVDLRGLIASYFFAMSFVMIPVGWLITQVKAKYLFYLAFFLFFLSSLGATLTTTIQGLILFRALQGIVAGIVFTLGVELIPDDVKSISIYSLATGLGLMLGPIIGGIFSDVLDWKAILWINMPLILLGVFLTWGRLNNEKPRGLWGFEFLNIKLVWLVFLACLAASFVTGVLFYRDAIYLKQVKGLSSTYAGLLLALVPAVQVILSLQLPRILRYVSLQTLLITGIISLAGSIILHRLFTEGTSLILILLAFFFMGLTWAIGNIGTNAVFRRYVANNEVALGVGMAYTLWNISSALLALYF